MRAIIFFLFFKISIIQCYAQKENVALNKPVSANSENPSFPVGNVIDGKISRDSKWMSSDINPPHILQLDLQKYCNIDQIIIYTGIPEDERTPEESLQADGFWSAKNFKLQYWDDANWTDIPNSEVHENRLTRVQFDFATVINTYKLRLVCDDGEPISIMEFQVFGIETSTSSPESNAASLKKKTFRTEDQSVTLRIEAIPDGKTMKYVGYNQGYYLPGSNTSGWVEYSGVNSFRVWTSLNTYVPLPAVQVDEKIHSVDEFDKRKAELRAHPESNRFIDWDILLPIYANPEKKVSTNAMVLNYVLSELHRLKIDPLIQAGSTDFTGTWSNKWQQWQRYYALAYYTAKTWDVTMFAMQNEPNHRNSGMQLDQWIRGMQIGSDAISCAIEDVNKAYGKGLTARMVGPVTAGNNPEWWAAVAKAIRTDYHGKTLDHDLIQLFSTHSYNSPAAGYSNRVNDIRKVITSNHPKGNALPIMYTEIGRWMNAYLIDKPETMDSPSLFTEWAGMYTNNTLNAAYGMWAFKFSNTVSNSYNQGIKSGHHFAWHGERIVEDAYTNLLFGKQVTAFDNSDAEMITDGWKTDKSNWKSDSVAEEKWVEIDMENVHDLGSAVVYTGSAGGIYTAPDRVRSFTLQYLKGNTWTDIPGGSVENNRYAQLFIRFKQPVSTSKMRFITSQPGVIKVREIKAFDVNDGPSGDQNNYDVSGIQRTGEVVRLFAKGFKDERPMFKTAADVNDQNLDAMTSYDVKNNNYYIWLVQRGTYNDEITIDLRQLPLPAGSIATAESVGPKSFGEVTGTFIIDESKEIQLVLPAQTVTLLTIHKNDVEKEIIQASADTYVSGGKNAGVNYGELEMLRLSLDAPVPENNLVTFIRFDLSEQKIATAARILLSVEGRNVRDSTLERYHVYGMPSDKWDERKLTWNNAPQLDTKEALIKDVGQKAFVAGEIAMGAITEDHKLDVTDLIKKHYSPTFTFALVRETRQLGDGKGKMVEISSKESGNPPQLEVYLNSSKK